MRAHFWVAGLGILLLIVPLAIGGIIQGFQLQDPNIEFTEVSRHTLMFLRVSTLGDLLIAIGHFIFVINVVGVVSRFCRARAVAAFEVATADLFKPVEARP